MGNTQEPTVVFPLWSASVPGALGSADGDIPTLTGWLPPPGKATGAAFVVCPGGAYFYHASHEGDDYARWLASHGIAAFVLKYRLGSAGYRHPAMLHDAARALRQLRHRSAEWGLDPVRIGIMGSSAGGHLASTLLTHFDDGDDKNPDPVERESSRPGLGILCYPVITMGEKGHAYSRSLLIGENPPADLVEHLSSERQVSARTPPCFVWHTWEDDGVLVENSLEFGRALRSHGVPFELHIYERGPHGIGLGTPPHLWTAACLSWLRERGYAAPENRS